MLSRSLIFEVLKYFIMTSVAVVLQIFSFYMVYNTSKRAELPGDALSVWFQQHVSFSTIVGMSLLSLSMILFIVGRGFGVGIFTGFLTLMITASLTVVLVPLKVKRN